MTDAGPSVETAIPISELSHLLLEIHKAMRADSNRLIRAVDSMEAGNVDGAAALGHAFSVIVHNIHEHHWAEDDLFYPFLIERIEGFEADVVRLEDDHVDLDAAMARINARFRLLSHPLSPGLWEAIHSHLATDVAAFQTVLTGHLDREEAAVVPAFETVVPDEAHTLQERALKRAKMRDLAMSVPWLMANITKEEEAELRAGAPKLLSVLHDHLWEQRFRRAVAPLYETSAM